MAARGERGRPKFPAGLRLEGTEPTVVGGSDEYKATGGRDVASEISCSCLEAEVTEFGKRFVQAEWNRQRDFAAVDVNGNQGTVWRRVTGYGPATRKAEREASAAPPATATTTACAGSAPTARDGFVVRGDTSASPTGTGIRDAIPAAAGRLRTSRAIIAGVIKLMNT